MKRILFLLIAAPMIFMGCGTTNSKTSDMKDTLNNSLTSVFWVLETLEGETIVHPDDPREIGFRLEEGNVSGFAGCNNFMGSYAMTEGNKIEFSSMASTKMACFTTTFDEQIFIRAFDKIDAYSFNNDKLELLSNGKVVATFNQSEKELAPVVEKYWKLKTLEGKEVEFASDQDQEVHFILKDHNKTVVGYAGCNSFSGNYHLSDDNTIEVSKLRSTLRVCPDASFNEDAFLKLFSAPTTYQVDGDALTLYKDQKAVATCEAIYFD